jgi:hypothetical protein
VNHDDMIRVLRSRQAVSWNRLLEPGLPDDEIADRLDHYRQLLERALPQLDDKWQDEADLIAEIKASINQ